MNLAKEMKEAGSSKEIVVEEKIHITETEEIIEEEIPLPVMEMFITKTENDGKDLIMFIILLIYRVILSLISLILPFVQNKKKLLHYPVWMYQKSSPKFNLISFCSTQKKKTRDR